MKGPEAVEFIIEQSTKLKFLFLLLENMSKENHRTLIFSQSTKMLDIIQFIFKKKDYSFLRIDGTIVSGVTWVCYLIL
jgi:SNF2 family DNA or RNA helicase